jgi:outer membrane assembly lipoprotein YfgL
MTCFPLKNSSKALSLLASVCVALVLGACSSTAEKPAPTALTEFTPKLTVSKVWSVQLSPISAPLTFQVIGSQMALVTNDGSISVIDTLKGTESWRLALNTKIAAGIGSDGERFAVISHANELITVVQGKEIWRTKLPALSFTAPLVAGGRVFVLTADRTVIAFDGASGQKLWSQQRSGDPLVLKQAGILTTFQDNLLVGLSGRLVAMNPNNGVSKWEVTMGSSRGTNEVERLVDLVAGVSRVNQVVCARSFQTAVTCVDAVKGASLWTRAAQGHSGVTGNENLVFGSDADGKLLAWQRQSGQVAWQSDAYRFRGLTAPAFAAGQLLVGDEQGWMHWLDTANGQALGRLQLDASGFAMPPVRVGNTWVAVAKTGLIQAVRAE